MRSTIQYLMKVTRECNLRCTYCNDWRSASPLMGLDVVEKVVESATTEPGLKRAAFIWHGGEPTILPISFYERTLAAQSALLDAGIAVENSIQTNGLRLNDSWIRFLADNSFGVGISIDGPPNVHDATRPTRSGRGSSAAVQAAMRRLHDSSVAFGVTIVASQRLMALGATEVWNFISSLPVQTVNLLPVREPMGGTAETISPEDSDLKQYSEFMSGLFDAWYDSPRPVDILVFRSLLAKLNAHASDTCIFAGRCFGMVFGVEPDGQVTHCPLFAGLSDFTLGSILQTDMHAIRRTAAFQQTIRTNEARLKSTQACRNYSVCSGGCPHFAFEVTSSSFNDSQCCGYDPLIEHIRQRSGTPPRTDLSLASL